MYFYTSETNGYTLFEKNEPSLKLMAYKILHERAAPKEEFEDWQSELMVAAWKATATWKPTGGYSYTTWAYGKMKNRLSTLKNNYARYQRHKPATLLNNIKKTGKAKPEGE